MNEKHNSHIHTMSGMHILIQMHGNIHASMYIFIIYSEREKKF